MINIRQIRAFGFPILQVTGSLEFGTFPKLLKSLEQVMHLHPRKVGLDLSAVDQVDRAGVVLLQTAAEAMAEHGGSLRLLGLSPVVRAALLPPRAA